MARLPAALILCACIALIAAPPAHAQETRPASAPLHPIPATQPLPALANTSVSIPWNELAQLIDRGKGAAPDRPPVDFVFAPAVYAAQVSGNGVKVSAAVDVTLLTDGYVLVPLGPDDAGVISVAIGNDPAPIVLRDRTLYALLSGKGKKHLAITAERSLVSDAGSTRLDLPLILSPLVTVTATIPGTGLDLKMPGASAVQVTEDAKGTTVAAAYPGGAAVAISWKQRPREAKQEPRLYADTETLCTVEKGLLRARSRVHLQIERAAVKGVTLVVDPKAVVLSVIGSGIAGWSEVAGKDAAGKETKTVVIAFAGPAEDERAIEIVTERDLPEAGGAMPVVPVAVEGAKRDRGVVAVETRGGFEVRPGDSSMERMSVSELPQSLREAAKGTLQIAYRYAGQPASATLVLEKIKPEPAKILATTQTRVAIERGVLRCKAQIAYEILHAGVDSLRLSLPPGIEVIGTAGEGIRGTQVIEENGGRTLLVGLKDVAKGSYTLVVDYDYRFDEGLAAGADGTATTRPATRSALATRPSTAPSAGGAALVAIPLLGHPGAAQDRGYIGIEVRGGYEVIPSVAAAERVDVKELPPALWALARSPLMFGYRYDAGTIPKIALSMTRHQDLDVLVAMSDVCEASTTYTRDGKSVTKMMFVMRNNLKPFMTLKMPEGAQVWSTFVDDRPVTPSLSAEGMVLIPLKKSEDVDEEDEKSYRARREKRRAERTDEPRSSRMVRAEKTKQLAASDDAARDLKPYDVEIVFVKPAVKFQNRGQLTAALPQSDVPIGQLSWAVFLPKTVRLAYAEGNLSEVPQFTLPFRHFGEVEWQRQQKLAEAKEEAQAAAQAQQELAKAVADAAKVQGVVPVRIEIPVVGEIHRFEKLLTVDEMPKMDLAYSRRVE